MLVDGSLVSIVNLAAHLLTENDGPFADVQVFDAGFHKLEAKV
jgi:hypothetical protein